MDILIGLVIATFIVAAAYVGYHESMQDPYEAKGHGIPTEPAAAWEPEARALGMPAIALQDRI